MKILVHDYAGHPFQVHLSRELARRGHHVTHAYFAGDPGPKGILQRQTDDPPLLHFAGIVIERDYDKSSLFARRFNDIEYGRRAAELVRELRPDVVISGNTPTEAQVGIIKACKTVEAAFVIWVQDFYSVAVSKVLRKRLGYLGRVIGRYYRWLERRQLRESAAIVVITEDFASLATRWGGDRAKVHVIENWAAIDDFPLYGKENPWSVEHGLQRGFTYVYSGTLGMKHNPDFLIALARDCGPGASVAVVAQGVGVRRLEAAKVAERLDCLRLFALQPAERLPEVLATADVLIAVIEADAGSYSVPSKVQSYLCAGRPILLAAPAENLAARVVSREQAGIVVAPDDMPAFTDAARRLRNDLQLCAALGARGRAYATRTFDITKIADTFEDVLFAAANGLRSNVARTQLTSGNTVKAETYS